jgi:hypothetical protein
MSHLAYDETYRRTYFKPETLIEIEQTMAGHSRFQLEFESGRSHGLALYELTQLINLDLLPVRMVRLLGWEGAGLKGEFKLIWEAPPLTEPEVV